MYISNWLEKILDKKHLILNFDDSLKDFVACSVAHKIQFDFSGLKS